MPSGFETGVKRTGGVVVVGGGNGNGSMTGGRRIHGFIHRRVHFGQHFP